MNTDYYNDKVKNNANSPPPAIIYLNGDFKKSIEFKLPIFVKTSYLHFAWKLNKYV